jgi:hypothetical protein
VADIFLSYVEKDRDRALQLAEALGEAGLSVSVRRTTAAWSEDAVRRATDAQIHSAKCVVVLLSHASIWPRSIVEELTIAQVVGASILRVLIEDVAVPNLFGGEVVANLSSWKGDRADPEFAKLRDLLEHELKPSARPNRVPGPPGPVQTNIPHDRRKSGQPSELRQDLFVCYRRVDAQGEAGRLTDRLVDAYGSERVFMDIDSVPLGIDFGTFVTQEIHRCKAVIVVIGRQWLKMKDKHRRRRLEDPEDLVRAEIAEALRQEIPVVPVLVQDASMPSAEDLPEDIRLLARRNGIALRHDQWRHGVERLLKELDPIMRGKSLWPEG